MPKQHSRPAPRGRLTSPLTPHLFAPTRSRPLRAKQHALEAEARVEPHRHPWAQLAFSATGVMRLTAQQGTYLVPPSRAVWIPPGVEHAITVVEDCRIAHALSAPTAYALRTTGRDRCRGIR